MNHWTNTSKIAFRFFFVFLSLQIFTENFWAFFLRIDKLDSYNILADLFTRPALWLNEHFFHRKYLPTPYGSFSETLHTIRDAVYLFISVITATIWSVLDRRRANYEMLHYWFSRFLVFVLSSITFAYGSFKLIPIQMSQLTYPDLYKQVGDLSPWQLFWFTMGYGQSYQVFTGFFEVAGSLFILFRRTRVVGLLIIASVMINVILINYAFSVGVLITSILLFLICLFLLAPFITQLFQFFFLNKLATLDTPSYRSERKGPTVFLTIIGGFLLLLSFSSNIRASYLVYGLRKASLESQQYYVVRNVDTGNAQPSRATPDSLNWISWYENVRRGKRLVTIRSQVAEKLYLLEKDSLQKQLRLIPVNRPKEDTLSFTYSQINERDLQLEGRINHIPARIRLQKANVDSSMKLLRTRRSIITLDDDPDYD